MKKFLVIFCIVFLLFTGCSEQPANLEQTAEPTAVPTPVPTEFVPAPLDPAELTEEQWEQMKNTKTCMTADGAVDLSTLQTSMTPYGLHLAEHYNNPDSLRYVDYYGTYQGYTAIRIHAMAIPGTDKEEVAGCTFYYSGYSDILFCRVLLWKDDTFYHLQYAYDQGLLTEEEIKTIAYYNNLGHFEPTVSASPVPDGPTPVPTEFVPAPIKPAELSEDVWARIRNTYQYVFNGELFKGRTFSLEYHTQPHDLRYYGTYQGYIAIYIKDITPYAGWVGKNEQIDGIEFNTGTHMNWPHGRIYLWQEDVFY